MPAGIYFRCRHVQSLAFIISSGSPTASFFCPTSHKSLLVSPVGNLGASLSFSRSYCRLPPPLSSRCYCTIRLRWCSLGAHILLLSILNWNLKMGAFNMPPPPPSLHPQLAYLSLPLHLLTVLFQEPSDRAATRQQGKTITLWTKEL